MAFTGGSRKKTLGDTQKGAYERRPQINDRLVTITGYNLDAGTMQASDERGFNFDIHIDPVAKARNEKYMADNKIANAKWLGHSIDSVMADYLKVGQKVVVEKGQIVKKANKNGQDYFVLKANRIINAPCQDPEKVFEGLFTVSQYKDRVSNVQAWSKQAIALEDEESITDLKSRIDEGHDAFGQKVADKLSIKPTTGFAFRAIIPNEGLSDNEKTKYIVVDNSDAFDWVGKNSDISSAPESVKQGAPVNSDYFEWKLEQYTNYLTDQYPDLLDKIKVEICWYDNFQASGFSKYMAINGEYDPIYQMAHTVTKMSSSPEDEDVMIGKNWAVQGIVQISDDDATKTGPGQFIGVPRNYVTRLHANNPKGHIHAWIHSSDDLKCEPHKAIQRVLSKEQAAKVNAKRSGNEMHMDMEGTQAAPQADQMDDDYEVPTTNTSAPAPIEDDFDPFASDFAASPAPAEEATPAPVVAQQPAAPATPAPADPAASPASRRFGRK